MKKKRIISLLMALLMMLTIFPAEVLAEDDGLEAPAEEAVQVLPVSEEDTIDTAEIPENSTEEADAVQTEETADAPEEAADVPEEAAEQTSAEVPAEHGELVGLEPVYVTIPDPLHPETETEDGLNASISFTAPRLLAQREVNGTLYDDDLNVAVETLRRGLLAHSKVITVNVMVPADTNGTVLLLSLLEQARAHTGVPEEGDYLRWVIGSCNAGAKGVTDYVNNYLTLQYDMTYYTTAKQEKAVTDGVSAALAGMELDGKSDYEKLTAIYQYIMDHCTYDHKNLDDDTYTLKHTAYAALCNETAVCQGYATLLYRMLLSVGIDCRFISGLGGGGDHAWNIVKLDGLWYNVDLTWDDDYSEKNSKVTIEKLPYFLNNTTFSQEHIRDEEFDTADFHIEYPMAADDYKFQIPCTDGEHDWGVSDRGAFIGTEKAQWVSVCRKCGISQVVSFPAAVNGTEACVAVEDPERLFDWVDYLQAGNVTAWDGADTVVLQYIGSGTLEMDRTLEIPYGMIISADSVTVKQGTELIVLGSIETQYLTVNGTMTIIGEGAEVDADRGVTVSAGGSLSVKNSGMLCIVKDQTFTEDGTVSFADGGMLVRAYEVTTEKELSEANAAAEKLNKNGYEKVGILLKTESFSIMQDLGLSENVAFLIQRPAGDFGGTLTIGEGVKFSSAASTMLVLWDLTVNGSWRCRGNLVVLNTLTVGGKGLLAPLGQWGAASIVNNGVVELSENYMLPQCSGSGVFRYDVEEDGFHQRYVMAQETLAAACEEAVEDPDGQYQIYVCCKDLKIDREKGIYLPENAELLMQDGVETVTVDSSLTTVGYVVCYTKMTVNGTWNCSGGTVSELTVNGIVKCTQGEPLWITTRYDDQEEAFFFYDIQGLDKGGQIDGQWGYEFNGLPETLSKVAATAAAMQDVPCRVILRAVCRNEETGDEYPGESFLIGNMTFPKNLRLCAYSEAVMLQIAQGATLTLPGGLEADVPVIVEGTLNTTGGQAGCYGGMLIEDGGLWVHSAEGQVWGLNVAAGGKLATAEGSFLQFAEGLRNDGTVEILGDYELYGIYEGNGTINKTLESSGGDEGVVTSLEKLTAALAQGGYIEYRGASLTFDKDLTIPEDVDLWINAAAVTVPEGVTVNVKGYVRGTALIVEGTLNILRDGWDESTEEWAYRGQANFDTVTVSGGTVNNAGHLEADSVMNIADGKVDTSDYLRCSGMLTVNGLLVNRGMVDAWGEVERGHYQIEVSGELRNEGEINCRTMYHTGECPLENSGMLIVGGWDPGEGESLHDGLLFLNAEKNNTVRNSGHIRANGTLTIGGTLENNEGSVLAEHYALNGYIYVYKSKNASAWLDSVMDPDIQLRVSEDEDGWVVMSKTRWEAMAGGDINGSGAVDEADLTLLARHVAGIARITDKQTLAVADLSGNDIIDAADLTALALIIKAQSQSGGGSGGGEHQLPLDRG